jgi:hypothetical protein
VYTAPLARSPPLSAGRQRGHQTRKGDDFLKKSAAGRIKIATLAAARSVRGAMLASDIISTFVLAKCRDSEEPPDRLLE